MKTYAEMLSQSPRRVGAAASGVLPPDDAGGSLWQGPEWVANEQCLCPSLARPPPSHDLGAGHNERKLLSGAFPLPSH